MLVLAHDCIIIRRHRAERYRMGSSRLAVDAYKLCFLSIIWRYSDRAATVCAHNGSLDHLAHPLWAAFGRAFAALDGSYGRMPRHSFDSVH